MEVITESFSQAFFDTHDLIERGEELFEHLPGFLFYVKDREGKFVSLNWALVEKFGVSKKEEVIGKTDEDFVPPYLAKSYAEDDAKVLGEGTVIANKVELLTNSDGLVDWYITSKVPLRTRDGGIRALAGVTRDFKRGTPGMQPESEMAVVTDFIRQHFGRRIRVAELSHLLSLSVSAFERRFRKSFHMSPLRYINRVRIHEACHALNKTNLPLVVIAQETGFCDQSHFTKEFIKVMNTTPRNYRKNHGKREMGRR
ncbi:MAG: AraC family transcriptional regulator [Verrucomicrobiales bacterium]|nr:AraC family transcriptional regulator [Verrucomicrobiales bacterium]